MRQFHFATSWKAIYSTAVSLWFGKAPPRWFAEVLHSHNNNEARTRTASLPSRCFTSSEFKPAAAAAAADVSIKIIISACYEDVTWGLVIDFPLGPTFKVQYPWQLTALLLLLLLLPLSRVRNGNKSYLFTTFPSRRVKAPRALLHCAAGKKITGEMETAATV